MNDGTPSGADLAEGRAAGARRLHILHLSADYPDPLGPAKTRAVANLLPLVPEHEHTVYSLNRVDWRLGIAAVGFEDAAGQGHRAVAYGAPPAGLFLERYLHRLADWVLADLAARGLRPDVVHAHKLSVEGLAGGRIAEALGVPLLISVQGDSDTKIVGAKRDLRGRYRALWHGAAAVFPFAPWARDRLDALLGARTGPTTLLPCPAAGPEFRARPVVTAEPVVATAFHLASWRRKNADGLFRAVALAAAEVPGLRLHVFGGGDAGAFAELSRLAERLAPGCVMFDGAVPHPMIAARFNAAAAFALVSHRESYGMVFAEALLAGTPCLIPAGAGIDGFFPDTAAVVSVPSRDPAAIATGLVRLVRGEAEVKTLLAGMQEDGNLEVLTRPRIAEAYRLGLRVAV
jgi:glycosyltransferase involved in cell wall biosynthesis